MEAKRKRHSGEICHMPQRLDGIGNAHLSKMNGLFHQETLAMPSAPQGPGKRAGWIITSEFMVFSRRISLKWRAKKRPHPICLTWATAFDSRPSHPGSRWKFAKNCCAASDTSLLDGCSSGQWHVGSMLIDKFICNRLRTGRKNPRESRDASSVKAASNQHVHLFQRSLRNLRYPKLICVILTKSTKSLVLV